MNFGTRNSATMILLGMNTAFFLAWIVTLFISVHNPALGDAATKLYGVFAGVQNALMLILNAQAGHENNQNPIPPGGPAQPK